MARVGSLAEVVEAAARTRQGGAGVILTNGAFDLLHVGHVRYLQGARALGADDLLVVAVNSDASVRGAKGSRRPVVPQAERCELVAALSGVDWVVLFDEPDVTQVIRALRPEWHAKGTDYTEETVPERAVVEACGGRVVIVGDPKDHSTSALMGRTAAAERD